VVPMSGLLDLLDDDRLVGLGHWVPGGRLG
jgi:hypothetical protein